MERGAQGRTEKKSLIFRGGMGSVPWEDIGKGVNRREIEELERMRKEGTLTPERLIEYKRKYIDCNHETCPSWGRYTTCSTSDYLNCTSYPRTLRRKQE